jgi:hypothetical protein
MSETAEFPLAFDATNDERDAAKREIGRYTEIRGDSDKAITLVGQSLGQTGPVWHYQYTRMYKVTNGYLAAGHDIREGIKVVFVDDPAKLPNAFADNETVREFLEDELRYRKILGAEHAGAH